MANQLPIPAESIAPRSEISYPEPFRSRMGQGNWRQLGDHFDITQFGINLEVLEPGAQSSVRHWHTLSDEFVYMLEGELTLCINEGEFPVTPGMCVGFKAGNRNAHHFINRSPARAKFLVVGSRVPGDTAFYPDDDLTWFITENGKTAVHKNGQPYNQK